MVARGMGPMVLGSTAGGVGPVRPPRDPIGYRREAMGWRKWSNWRQFSAGLVDPILVPGGSPAGHEAAGGDREATPRWRVCPAPASGIQPAGMHPQPGPGRARVRRRRPARRCVCHDRGPVRIGGPCVSRGAQAGGVRPLPPPATRRCRGAVRPYAMVRRTRRRGDAVRGAAGPAAWGRPRTGTACACCAR